MPNSPTSPRMHPGDTCDRLCSRCSTWDNRPVLKPHVLVVSRGRLLENRFWECTACGHRIRAFQNSELANRTDPETELLHAQWREDNEGYPRWTRDHRP
jgi:hypothetical protein